MTIAVDFDGTIVTHEYPKIGKPIPFAIETLRKLEYEGHKLILWSVREGKLLDEAVEYCSNNGLEFYAVNKNDPEEDIDHCQRKLAVDIFIDDRNIGGLPDWGVIYRIIKSGENRLPDEENETYPDTEYDAVYKRKGFWSKLSEALNHQKRY